MREDRWESGRKRPERQPAVKPQRGRDPIPLEPHG
jgi:hypothetical protein